MVAATEVTVDALMALRLQPPRPPGLSRRPGTTATRPRGQGHEIREIRPYDEGDDLRHLDAAATARTGRPQVRSFHEDRDRSLMLIADFRRPMLWGTARFRSVRAAEALAIAGWQAGAALSVAAITDAGTLSASGGMAQVAGCLAEAHALALTGGAAVDLVPPLVRAARTAPRGGAVLLASALDRTGPGLEPALLQIARRGPLRIALLPDPFELAPPARPLAYAAPHGTALGRFDALPERHADLARRLAELGAEVE